MPRGVYPRRPGLKRNRSSRPAIERFWEKVEKTEGCWLWRASTNVEGYGKMSRGRAGEGTMLAHRFAYEHFVGPIPEGAPLDHLCRVRNCVNPAHLEIVTHAINARRKPYAKLPYRGTGKCRRGHDQKAEGCYVAGRYIYCRACRRDRRRAAREAVAEPGT